MQLHLFFIKTPLEYFAAEAIVKALPEDDAFGLITYEKGIDKLVELSLWNFHQQHYLRGFKGNQRLKKLASYNRGLLLACQPFMEKKASLRLNIPRLKNNHSNYFVSLAVKEFGKDNVRISIIPHGLADAVSGKVSVSSFVKMLAKAWNPFRRIVYGLKYFAFLGDAQGRDNGLVDQIYHLPGICPPEFTGVEVREVIILTASSEVEPKGVLILGQPLFRHNIITEQEEMIIGDAMYEFIQSSGVNEPVDFLPHPRCEEDREFFRKGYRMLENDAGMEALLVRKPYKVVMSYCSSGLFTARMILGPDAQIVSMGFNLGAYPEKTISSTRSAFEQYSVDVVDCKN